MDDTLQLMGSLVRHPAGMAVAAAIGKRKADILAYADQVLAEAHLSQIGSIDKLSQEIKWLQRLGIVEAKDPARLTERGLKIVSLLLYGTHWKEHTDPAERSLVA